MQDDRANFPPGKVIRAHYIVEELLGKGGFGAVYRVRERRIRGNTFALKEVIDPNRQQRERFTFEGEILKRLSHPALPRVYQLFEDRKHHRLYMLMDYIEGVNLEQLRQQQPGKRFSLSTALAIMTPIVEAISYLHAQQPPIIHRDIKPANIIVSPSGDRAVLVDFGIAKECSRDATTTAVRHCSPGYGAPEQYATGTDIRTDIYGLAATFYKLLTGHVPVDAFYRLTRLGSGEIDPLEPVTMLVPTLPPYVADGLQRAMAMNSSDRFATVEEFWHALQGCPAEQEVCELALEKADDAKPPTSQTLSPVAPEAPVLSLLVTPDNAPVAVAREGLSRQRPVRKAIFFLLVALVLVGLFSGVIFGAGKLPELEPTYDVVVITPESTPISVAPRLQSTLVPSKSASPSATVSSTAQPTTPSVTPTVKPTITPVMPTPTPTAQPAVSSPTPITTPLPRSMASGYPVLLSHYHGTISDQFSSPFRETSLDLAQMRQEGEKVSGYLSAGSGFIDAGSFSGTLAADRSIQFIVPGNSPFHPLFFQGHLQEDGSML
ncbi:MAG TPA: serine/threonine-protein kinase, partial [Ktedonobacteraceae bacterium]|nr:serine/threonine-protein kinase [Ktedonobacteraceae bacterium]